MESTKLDTIETTHRPQDIPTYKSYLIAKDPDEYYAAADLYLSINPDPESNQLKQFADCRTFAQFIRNNFTGEVSVSSNSCKLRFCPLCSSAKRRLIRHEVSGWSKGKKNLKFITLTLKHTGNDLKSQVDMLYSSFQKLRKNKIIRKKLFGGIWFFQITQGKEDGLWHPHLHVLADCMYIDKYKLSAVWQAITHTSKIIDIRQIYKPEKTIDYVARYGSVPVRLASLSVSDRQELYYALHGRRIISTFGNARSLSFRPHRTNDDDEYTKLGNWTTIIGLKDYDDTAAKIFDAWREKTTLDPGISCINFEQELYNDHPLHLPEPHPPDPQKNLY